MAKLLWMKYAQNKHENFTAEFRRSATDLVHPLGLAEKLRFRCFGPNFAVSRLGVSGTLPLCSNPSHGPIN